MREFVTVKLRCPLCGTEFAADELHGAEPVGRETDFRPVHEGQAPLSTRVHSCPGCAYSGYREAFETEPSDEDELVEVDDDDPKSLPRPFVAIPGDEDLADLRRYTRSGELVDELVAAGEVPYGAVRFLLCARIHDFVVEGEPLVSAHYELRAAWAARATGERALEKRALRELLLKLSNVLESDANLGETEKLRLTYLAGEVARRAGDFARAVDFFARVDDLADSDEDEGALYLQLARRLGQLAQMKSDVNAVIPPDLPTRRREGDGEDEDGAADDEGSGLN